MAWWPEMAWWQRWHGGRGGMAARWHGGQRWQPDGMVARDGGQMAWWPEMAARWHGGQRWWPDGMVARDGMVAGDGDFILRKKLPGFWHASIVIVQSSRSKFYNCMDI